MISCYSAGYLLAEEFTSLNVVEVPRERQQLDITRGLDEDLLVQQVVRGFCNVAEGYWNAGHLGGDADDLLEKPRQQL